MKKILVVAFAGMILVGCGDPAAEARNHQLRMQESQQKHELEMARIQAGVGTAAPIQQYSAPQQQAVHHEPVQSVEQPYQGGAAYGGEPSESSGSDSGIGSTILAVGAGALAGYAISELLDDGYRSYSDKSGRTVYVDKNGRQIDKRDYDAYKAKHPTKHALSTYNQQGKQAVNTAKTKTVEAASVAKTKTVEAAKKVDQKVVQPVKKTVQKKISSFKSSSSKRR